MIISNCPFLVKHCDYKCEYNSVLNKEGCVGFDNCPFKQVVEACQDTVNCEWSRDWSIEAAKKILEVFEVEE